MKTLKKDIAHNAPSRQVRREIFQKDRLGKPFPPVRQKLGLARTRFRLTCQSLDTSLSCMNPVRPLLIAATLLFCAATTVSAENAPLDHPAVALVKGYLEAIVRQDWKDASEMLLPSALERRRQKVAAAIKNSSTMTEEAAKLNMLGIKDVRELEKMSPQEAYILDRKAVHDRMKISPETLKRKIDTLKIKIIGVASEEDGKVVHVVVRTSQETEETLIEELLLISAAQDRDNPKKWLIVPDMQEPMTTPLKGATTPAVAK
jgi:hypothetical protein